MRLDRLLMASCAVLLIAGPAPSFAQPSGQGGSPDQRDQRKHDQDQGRGQGGQQGQGANVQAGQGQGGGHGQGGQGQGGQGQGGRGQGGQAQGQGGPGPGAQGPTGQGQGGQKHRGRGQVGPGPGGQPGAVAGQGAPATVGRTPYTPGPQGPPTGAQGELRRRGQGPQVGQVPPPTVGGQAQVGAHPQFTPGHPIRPAIKPPPAGTPQLGGWTRSLQGFDRNRTAQTWRSQHHGWDNNAVWRRNRNWWHNDNAFRSYYGVRAGFWFVPMFGYISVPWAYQHHYWRAGEFLPEWFWRYEVVDYWRYGLPAPPYGCAWIWVNNDIALVDFNDGYIIDMVYNVW